jgi:hypothetical protein
LRHRFAGRVAEPQSEPNGHAQKKQKKCHPESHYILVTKRGIDLDYETSGGRRPYFQESP